MTTADAVTPLPRRLSKSRAARRRDVLRGLEELGFVVPRFDDMQTYGRMKFLHDAVVNHAPEGARTAVEIGVYRGCSTVFLGMACRRRGVASVTAIDLFTGTAGWNQMFDTKRCAEIRMRRYGLDDRVRLVRANSQEFEVAGPIDILHIDGDHRYEAVVADIERYVPHLTEGGIVIFDDYDLAHRDVRRAVHELLASRDDLHVVATNWQDANGSVCLKRVTRR